MYQSLVYRIDDQRTQNLHDTHFFTLYYTEYDWCIVLRMSPKIHEHIQRAFLSSREALFNAWGKRAIGIFFVLAVLLIASALSYAYAFGPPRGEETRSEFVIAPGETLLTVADRLETDGLVKYAAAFRFVYGVTHGDRTLRPGGYELTPSMDALALAKKLGEAPYLAWVSIPEAGLRKEEVADILEETLGWTTVDRNEWLATINALPDLREGIFLPDTYLIPSDQPPSQVAARLRSRFEETIAVYTPDIFASGKDTQHIITLASLIEREAAKNDKRLVAGILTNRLERGMKLQVDATLQYLAGTKSDWWPVPDAEDKYTESPFNTYIHTGLPPEPIATPSLESIEAALNPQSTKCLYYLHDQYGRIHCTTTYSAHLANVKWYLR